LLINLDRQKLSAATYTGAQCIRENCALYLKVHKSRILGRYADPENYLVYEGCGLVHNIAWTVKKIERPNK